MAESSLKGPGMPGASGAREVVESEPPEPVRPGWGGDRYRILIHLSESLVGADGSWDAFLDDGGWARNSLLSIAALQASSTISTLSGMSVICGDLPNF
jgi:hypothetical protein